MLPGDGRAHRTLKDHPQLVRPILVINPRSDEAFVKLARQLVEDGATTIDALELGLRRQFPKARVGERRLSGEATVTWYVYRDGMWSSDGAT